MYRIPQENDQATYPLHFSPGGVMRYWCSFCMVALAWTLFSGGAGADTLDPQTIPKLLKALDGKDRKARLEAMRALGRFGSAAKEAVGPLAAIMRNDTDAAVAAQAAVSLAQIGLPAVPVLQEARLGADPLPVRIRAATALGVIGPDAKDAVKSLVTTLNDPSDQL